MLFKNLQQGNKVNKQRDEIQHADYLPPERGENNTSDVASSSIFLFSLNFLSPLDVFQHLCLWICKAAGVRFTCRQVPVQQAQSILGFCIFFFIFYEELSSMHMNHSTMEELTSQVLHLEILTHQGRGSFTAASCQTSAAIFMIFWADRGDWRLEGLDLNFTDLLV